MNKKHLLLLSFFSTSSLFPMLSIPEPKLTKHINNFLKNLSDKSFDLIAKDYNVLSDLAQHTIIYCCENLSSCKPLQAIIMIAALPEEIRHNVVAQLLNLDQKSVKLFCSLSIKEAFDEYTKAKTQAEAWRKNSLDLPVGFHYRVTDETCQLLQRIMIAEQNSSHLMIADQNKGKTLLAAEPWLTKTLNISTDILHKVSLEQKIYGANQTISIWSNPDMYNQLLLPFDDFLR